MFLLSLLLCLYYVLCLNYVVLCPNLTNLRFAYDIVLIAKNLKELEVMAGDEE